MKTFHLPDLGEGLAEAEIRAWYVQAGETVEMDQPLLSVETAKAIVDVPSPFTGTITRLLGEVGERIQTHAPLVEFAGDAGSVVGALPDSGVLPGEVPMDAVSAEMSHSSTVRMMPAVRALARELGVDPCVFQSHTGHITAEDVRKAAAKQSSGEILQGVRRAMAQAMIRSAQECVPATLMDEVAVSECLSDFTVDLIQAMAAAVQEEPALNATFDGKNLSRTRHTAIHLGLAIDSSEGLFVPVLKNVGECSRNVLRQNIDHLKQAVKNRTVRPEELQGATLILSNFGTIAGRYASPILLPPSVAILGCGKIYEGVVVKDGKITASHLAPLSLTFDHRAVTGGEASRWLAAVIRFLQRTLA